MALIRLYKLPRISSLQRCVKMQNFRVTFNFDVSLTSNVWVFETVESEKVIFITTVLHLVVPEGPAETSLVRARWMGAGNGQRTKVKKNFARTMPG
jgi:hypothetical protein